LFFLDTEQTLLLLEICFCYKKKKKKKSLEFENMYFINYFINKPVKFCMSLFKEEYD